MPPALTPASLAVRIALPVLLFGAAVSLLTLRSNASSPPAHLPPAHLSPGQAALRVQIDPETGALVPAVDNPGDPRALSPESALSHSLQRLRVEMRADGSLHVDLQDRFMESTVATIDASGGTRLGCLPAGQAEQRVQTTATVPAPTGAVER